MAGGRYSKIHRRMWNDEEFSALTCDCKLLWVYLLSSPDANMCGLYRMSGAEKHLGFSEAKLTQGIEELRSVGMVEFDYATSIVWLKNWFKYNPPDGPKQLKGCISQLEELPSHRFSKALGFVLWALSQGSSVAKSELSKKHALLVRDHIRCVYCGRQLSVWSECEIDHVIPASRKSENGKYEDLVSACKECNQKKGDKTAEEFGYPFVTGSMWDLKQAAFRLVTDAQTRSAFSRLCNGLPVGLTGIDSVSALLDTPGMRNWYSTDTQSSGYRFQDQDQDQEQEQEQEDPPKAPQGGQVVLAIVGEETAPTRPRKRAHAVASAAFEAFWQAYPQHRHVEKAEAIKAWPGDEFAPAIMAALAWQTTSQDWTKEGGTFVPHPKRYLAKKRWTDEKPQPVECGARY